jgi:hypothetical protein
MRLTIEQQLNREQRGWRVLVTCAIRLHLRRWQTIRAMADSPNFFTIDVSLAPAAVRSG